MRNEQKNSRRKKTGHAQALRDQKREREKVKGEKPMSDIDISLNDNRSAFDKFCESMYAKYKKEKSRNREKDVLSYNEYRTQHKMFLRRKYREKKAAALKKKLGLD